jgi:MFS family permease
MQNPKPLMLKISRPLHLLLAALTYALGASLADYLAVSFVAGSFWFGLVVVLLVQLSMSLLPEIFRLDVEPLEENETRAGRQMLRNNILYVSIASLAFVVLILYSLFTVRQLPLLSIFFIGLSLGIVVLQLESIKFVTVTCLPVNIKDPVIPKKVKHSHANTNANQKRYLNRPIRGCSLFSSSTTSS